MAGIGIWSSAVLSTAMQRCGAALRVAKLCATNSVPRFSSSAGSIRFAVPSSHAAVNAVSAGPLNHTLEANEKLPENTTFGGCIGRCSVVSPCLYQLSQARQERAGFGMAHHCVMPNGHTSDTDCIDCHAPVPLNLRNFFCDQRNGVHIHASRHEPFPQLDGASVAF